MSIQASLREFGTALRSLEGQYNVYHYWRPQMATPFIVWAETGEADALHGDNRKGEVLMNITVDVYTSTGFSMLSLTSSTAERYPSSFPLSSMRKTPKWCITPSPARWS